MGTVCEFGGVQMRGEFRRDVNRCRDRPQKTCTMEMSGAQWLARQGDSRSCGMDGELSGVDARCMCHCGARAPLVRTMRVALQHATAA